MPGIKIAGVSFSGAEFLPPAKSAVNQLIAGGTSRGFYTADSRWCTISDLKEIDVFRTRDVSGFTLTPASGKAQLGITSGIAQEAADFTSSPYVHSYSKPYGSGWAFGFAFKPESHTSDQFLMAVTGFDIRIPASTSNLVLRYNGATEMTIPITHGSWTSIFCGYPGTKMRAWKNGVQVGDVNTTDVAQAASFLHLGGDMSNAFPWRGWISDVIIYSRYEPAFNVNLPQAWHDYVKVNYGIA